MIKMSIRRGLIFTVVSYPLFLFAQFTKVAPFSCDSLTFDTLKIPLLMYMWDQEFEDYELIDTLKSPHIIEVLYSDSNVRRRIFVKANDSQSSNINYMEDGSLLQFTFGAYYKGTLWWFSGDQYSLMFQAYPEGQKSLIAEFSKRKEKYKWRKDEINCKILRYWKLVPRHGKPVKYARKLLRIYKAQYKDIFYHLDNCIWY